MTEIDPNLPPFFDLLDRHPGRAAELFYRYVVSLLEVSLPRKLKHIPEEQRKDLFHDIVVHCIKDDFRVLRQYTNIGRPFAAWFYFVANNKIRDYIEKHTKDVEANAGESSNSTPIKAEISNPETSLQSRELLELVNECIAELDAYCQVLLRLAGEEFKPREMVGVLGWAKEKAKKVSNDLGYCRSKLQNLLFARGVDIETVDFA